MHRKHGRRDRVCSTTACWCRAPCRACWPACPSCGSFCSCRLAGPILKGMGQRRAVAIGALHPAAAPGALDHLRAVARVSVVWLAYGMRLVSSSLLQVGPELEEAARAVGASARPRHPRRHAAADQVRHAGRLADGVPDFRARILDRRLSALARHRSDRRDAGVAVGTGGSTDLVAALSFINIALVAIGLGVALRFGVKLHD